jgi:hypothetical protein
MRKEHLFLRETRQVYPDWHVLVSTIHTQFAWRNRVPVVSGRGEARKKGRRGQHEQREKNVRL